MSAPDIINGLFEAVGGTMNWLNVVALYRDKEVKGVRILPQAIFFIWGVWNLYYYPHLNQWMSFTGGLVIVLANCVWVSLALFYARK